MENKRPLDMIDEGSELTEAQIAQQDAVDNACFNLITELAISPGRTIEWDIALITKVREAVEEVICDDLKLMSHMDFYPWINDAQDREGRP